MDPDVARLVREQRLVDAARLASGRGDPRRASEIYEQACEWSLAAAEAIRAGDASRAIELALRAGDEATAQQALALVSEPAAMQTAAGHLVRRGRYAWAARLFESCGRKVDAARLWERGGDVLRAAALLEDAGETVEAARVLQAAVLRDPGAWGAGVALGTILDRLGKWEAAVRLLQRVPLEAPERREALVPLVHSLQRLGLGAAASEAAKELAGSPGGSPAKATADALAAAGPAGAARVLGRYQVVREVGSSPIARLLECFDVVRGERVAVKLLAGGEARNGGGDALARLEREAQAVRALQHPSVVPSHGFFPEGPALVFAWMGGGSLERMMAELGPIAPERAVEIASALLAALGAAHRIGIVHRNVKPSNVLFDGGGGARLGDFGVAHWGDLSTTATAGVDTMAYVSPEQRGGRPATAASDVFAVGVMLREMLTGERPRPDDHRSRLPSEAHRGLDARHDAAVLRLAARDPLARPADAFEARALLASLPWPRAVDADTVKRQKPISTPSPRPPERRLAIHPDGTVLDGWTERRIERVSLTEHTLARARAFALADHPALQPVWRVDVQAGVIWLGALDGRSIDRPLTLEERARIREALDALHAAGGAHGRVDRQHIVDAPEGVVLRFGAADDASATAERDKAALAKL